MPNVLITGANRGLGLEFARQYSAEGWTVIVTARDPGGASELRGLGVRVEPLDMTDLAAVRAFAGQLDGVTLDLLIANAGISGPGGGADTVDGNGWSELFTVNVIAPTLLAGALLPLMADGGKLVAISSLMGSIADNQGGGSMAYRTSKAALNAAWRTMAIDWKARPVTVAMLHPGWVQTDMGGRGAPLKPPESIAGMRKVIAGLERSDTGSFINYDGSPLPW
jgi:NAD(P)-dependent dehydrogenase (short-subunit alcohol dehydrogenase family)